MGLDATVIPDHLARLMSPEDRKSFGKGGMTANEARDVQMARDEKEAQQAIRKYLGCHDIEFICPPMNKRSSLPVGWPDVSFAYLPKGRDCGVPLALEVKVWGRKPRPEQSAMHARLRANGWRVEVISGVADVQRIFRELDQRENTKT